MIIYKYFEKKFKCLQLIHFEIQLNPFLVNKWFLMKISDFP